MAMKIRGVNMVPRSRSSETNNDSETNLSVNPADPRQIAGTAFTPSGGPNTPIYLSSDGGETWTLAAIVPGGTGDFNVKFSSKALYGGNLRPAFGLTMDVLRTTNTFGGALMTVIDARPPGPNFFDQPWVQTWTVQKGPDAGKDRLYVGCNDLTIFPGATASIDLSPDGIAGTPAFTLVRLDSRGTAGHDGPSVRAAVHRKARSMRPSSVGALLGGRPTVTSSWSATTTGAPERRRSRI